METKKAVLAIPNSTPLLAIVLWVLFSLPFLSYSQQVNNNEKYSFERNNWGEYELTSFTCKGLEGKVFIKWTVLESSNECIYVLERSNDNRKFNKIHTVRASKSPNNMELLNSFVDEKPMDGTSYYRVRRISSEHVISSKSMIVNGIIIESDYTMMESAQVFPDFK